jgi:hypothetical protein
MSKTMKCEPTGNPTATRYVVLHRMTATPHYRGEIVAEYASEASAAARQNSTLQAWVCSEDEIDWSGADGPRLRMGCGRRAERALSETEAQDAEWQRLEDEARRYQ